MVEHNWDHPPDGWICIEGAVIKIEVCTNRCGAIRKMLLVDGQSDWQMVHCKPNPIPDECQPNDYDFHYGDWIVRESRPNIV